MKPVKYHSLFLICLCLFSISSIAQNLKDREYIKSKTNTEALRQLAIQFKAADDSNHAKAIELAIPMRVTNENGITGAFYSFNEKGEPIYTFDDNVNAANTCRTNRIWTGGSSGLNLNGFGIEIGVWESGKALPTHVEFGGRALDGGDGASVTSHGTHTGGTLIASGVNSAARGMASSATIRGYTASSMAFEASNFAAAGGILANNSNTPSGTNGVYDANARDIDNVAFNAPFYFHGKSAGNDGNTYGVMQSTQLAKNVLSVANCADISNYIGASSVVMSSSSSFGPSNDWRIKPDITNNGVSLTSSDNVSNTSYISMSGTSMATPATVGSIALLQQHYNNMHSVYMRSATVKALVINTADEAGLNDGPDFASGWGLMNTERAAQYITNKGISTTMDELVLTNGGTYSKTFTSDGTTPLSLTICWTDPTGSLGSGTTPVLVNDLDVRVTGNSTTYFPWAMVPNGTFNNYTSPAQKVDNFRDNVEKINAVLPAGNYTITVTHKGTLTGGTQAFSLVLNNQLSVLPVNDLVFTARKLNADALLQWKTKSEINVSRYEIERSTNGINYAAIGQVISANSAATQSYHFTDVGITTLNANYIFYRLKMVDVDGHYSYSKVAPIALTNKQVVAIFPNPTNATTQLIVNIVRPELVKYSLIDLKGRIVQQQQWNVVSGSQVMHIDLSGLPKGLYFVVLKGKTINERKRLVKQ